MGTSNWQQIPFCVDALMKIAPQSVLDVGVGFGRWGMITREFCDVWFSRVFKDDWNVRVEGIEAFPKSVSDYHASFYNKIHVGDAADILPKLTGPWSVIIFGDVLEHFTKEKANELLRLSLDRSDYVLVNIPIGEEFEQGEAYGNVYERHLSQWWPDDFKAFGLIRHIMLKDYIGRPYGSFVLSKRDPKDLTSGLFSRGYTYDEPEIKLPDSSSDADLLRKLQEQIFELRFIKDSSTYRTATALRTNPVVRLLRNWTTDASRNLKVQVLGRPGRTGLGTEAWVLGVQSTTGEPAIPYEFIDFKGDWKKHDLPQRPYGVGFTSGSGSFEVRTGHDPCVTLMRHPWSGLVKIDFAGRSETIDLSDSETGDVTIHPGRHPMTVTQVRTVVNTPNAITSPPAPDHRVATPAERLFIDTCRAQRADFVAIHCPRWLGVSASTKTLFNHCYPVPADPSVDPASLSKQDCEHHAEILAQTGARHFIFSGGDETHLHIAESLRRIHPECTADLFWHGSYLHVSDEYVWRIWKLWMNSVRTGITRSILTCKAGMEDFLRSIGIPSSLVLNYVPGDVQTPPDIDPSTIHAGLWLSGPSWRKSPYAMIAAAKLIGNVRLHGANIDPAGLDMMREIGLDAESISATALKRDDLFAAIRQTHLSLYVTLSECSPMLPLESMHLGVPCLVGPSSHLFEDCEFLRDRLVVPFPERADVIAAFMKRAFEERHAIMDAFTHYAPEHNAMARELVQHFMSEGPTLTRTTRNLSYVQG